MKITSLVLALLVLSSCAHKRVSSDLESLKAQVQAKIDETARAKLGKDFISSELLEFGVRDNTHVEARYRVRSKSQTPSDTVLESFEGRMELEKRDGHWNL